MALTPSSMLPLGTPAPDFTLPDVVTGQPISLSTFTQYKGYLIMFICRHCPYVMHIQNELVRLGNDYRYRGIAVIAISSNDANRYPEDGPAKLKGMALDREFSFPLCYDEFQAVARAYHAACTPDFFLFDQDKRLVYRGQLDDSRPGNQVPVTGVDLRSAINAVLSGQAPDPDQRPSMGCNIKWKEA